jgi:hypothetical protein
MRTFSTLFSACICIIYRAYSDLSCRTAFANPSQEWSLAAAQWNLVIASACQIESESPYLCSNDEMNQQISGVEAIKSRF